MSSGHDWALKNGEVTWWVCKRCNAETYQRPKPDPDGEIYIFGTRKSFSCEDYQIYQIYQVMNQ